MGDLAPGPLVRLVSICVLVNLVCVCVGGGGGGGYLGVNLYDIHRWVTMLLGQRWARGGGGGGTWFSYSQVGDHGPQVSTSTCVQVSLVGGGGGAEGYLVLISMISTGG